MKKAHAPGQQQRLERPPVQETDDAALEEEARRSRHEEGDRQGDEEVVVEGGGHVELEPSLDHEGGVGPQRHQLAVGHVDHAHQPEDDRQPEGHQQENGGEREPLEAGLDGLGQEPPALDALDGALRRLLQRRRALRIRSQITEPIQGVDALECSESLRGRHALDLGPRAQPDEGHRLLEGVADPAVVLPGEGVGQDLERAGIAPIAHLGRRRRAHGRVRIAEVVLPREGVDERAQQEPQAAPGRHLLQRRQLDEQRLALGAGEGLTAIGGEERDEGLVAFRDLVPDDDGLLAAAGRLAHVHAALAQRLQQRQDLAVPGLAEGDRRRLLDGRVARGHAGDVLGDLRRGCGARRRRGGQPRQQRERHEERREHDASQIGRLLKRVQVRGGARRPHARRTPCAVSARAPTKQMGPFRQPASVSASHQAFF